MQVGLIDQPDNQTLQESTIYPCYQLVTPESCTARVVCIVHSSNDARHIDHTTTPSKVGDSKSHTIVWANCCVERNEKTRCSDHTLLQRTLEKTGFLPWKRVINLTNQINYPGYNNS